MIESYRIKGETKKANEIQDFVDLFFQASREKDFKKRMNILFKGRKHALDDIVAKRQAFVDF